MFAWFDALPFLEKVFYYVAMPATAILLVQTLMLIFGGFGAEQDGADGVDIETDTDFDADADFDADFDADADFDDVSDADDANDSASDSSGIKLITTRGVLSFFAIAGWTGILFMELRLPDIFAISLALIFGIGAMITVAYLVRALMRLDASGRKDYRGALGQVCDVYLTIPANNTGFGKVSMDLGGRYSEYDAITNCDKPIKTGEVVRVVDIVGVNTMVVEPEE